MDAIGIALSFLLGGSVSVLTTLAYMIGRHYVLRKEHMLRWPTYNNLISSKRRTHDYSKLLRRARVLRSMGHTDDAFLLSVLATQARVLSAVPDSQREQALEKIVSHLLKNQCFDFSRSQEILRLWLRMTEIRNQHGRANAVTTAEAEQALASATALTSLKSCFSRAK
jgi:hypothetical protein